MPGRGAGIQTDRVSPQPQRQGRGNLRPGGLPRRFLSTVLAPSASRTGEESRESCWRLPTPLEPSRCFSSSPAPVYRQGSVPKEGHTAHLLREEEAPGPASQWAPDIPCLRYHTKANGIHAQDHRRPWPVNHLSAAILGNSPCGYSLECVP